MYVEANIPLCNCYSNYQHRCCAVLGVDRSHQGLQVVLRPEDTLYKRGLAPLEPSTQVFQMIVYQLYWVVVDTVVLVYISCAEKKIRKEMNRLQKKR